MRSTGDGGGVTNAAASEFGLSATAGQPVAGDVSNLPYRLISGFWTPMESAVGIDLDGDVDSDLRDAARFVNCFGGADVPYDPIECAQADLDHNDDVDREDLGSFLFGLTGPR